MKVNQEGIKLLHEFENCKLEAYLCPSLIPTIGYGNTFYANGAKVKLGDRITQAEADKLFEIILSQFEKDVLSLLTASVNENQFSALTSFAYNVGSDIDIDKIPEGLGDSTLLKKVNSNPNDPSIEDEFKKWNKSKGKVLNGLIRRREAESKLYFK